MPIGEIILGFIGEMIGYILFDLIIEGIGRFFRGIYCWILKFVTGKERKTPDFERIEKRYLYKKVSVISNFHELLPKGTRGTVMKVIDKQIICVEFENSKGRPIVVNDEQGFKIKRSKVTLERKTNPTTISSDC
jgi:hypothetical protein